MALEATGRPLIENTQKKSRGDRKLRKKRETRAEQFGHRLPESPVAIIFHLGAPGEIAKLFFLE